MDEKIIIAIHRVGEGTCSFSGKQGEGFWCSFGNGSIRNQFLTFASFKKLLNFQYPCKEKDKRHAIPEATSGETVPVSVDGVSATQQRRA